MFKSSFKRTVKNNIVDFFHCIVKARLKTRKLNAETQMTQTHVWIIIYVPLNSKFLSHNPSTIFSNWKKVHVAGICTYFIEYPSAEHRLYCIINYENFSKLKRFSVFHQSWPERLGKVTIEQTYKQRREWTGQHRPAVYSGI